MWSAWVTILKLLAERGPRRGQELVEDSAGSLSRGMVYVHLDALAERGYVESELKASPRGRPARRVFWITDEGREALDEEEEERRPRPGVRHYLTWPAEWRALRMALVFAGGFAGFLIDGPKSLLAPVVAWTALLVGSRKIKGPDAPKAE